jgi:hypothetical protein
MIRTKITTQVEKIAAENNIIHEENSLDSFADIVTELAGDEVKSDPTLDLIVSLKRAGLISKSEVASLSLSHLKEKKTILSKTS